jgi:hypothetical protein
MKQISILLSYVFDDYLKTCKLLEVPNPTHYIIYLYILFAILMENFEMTITFVGQVILLIHFFLIISL